MLFLILLTTAIPIFFIGTKILPLRLKLFLCVVLSIPQFYLVEIGESYISLAGLAALLLFSPETANSRKALKNPAILCVILLAAYQFMSLAWSSDYKLGLKVCSVLIVFIAVYLGSYRLGLVNSPALMKMLRLYGLLLFSASISTIAFRLSPDLEGAYLESAPADALLGPGYVNGLESGEILNNILDSGKSAGLYFGNANPAACYLGISAFITWYVATVFKSRLLKLSAMTAFVAVFFTGSKSAVILGVMLALMAVLLTQRDRSRKARVSLYGLIAMGVIVSAGLAGIFSGYVAEFSAETGGTSATRYWIWEHAAEEFRKSPVLGQGFGGWAASFSGYADQRTEGFPPHNTLISLWSQSGIVAPLIAIAFMFFVCRSAFRLISRGDADGRALGVTLATTSIWLFAQGMGENWGLVGEAHQEVLLAVLIAMVHLRGAEHFPVRMRSAVALPTAASHQEAYVMRQMQP